MNGSSGYWNISASRPPPVRGPKKTRVSFLINLFGSQITEPEALALVQHISQAGHLTIGDKGKVTYHLTPA